MITIDDYNYFDVAEAIHCYCILWHSGQNSELYSILSRSQFKPSPTWTESEVELENEFYNELTEDNVRQYFENLTKFMETK